jgi:dienelactone hydrolase
VWSANQYLNELYESMITYQSDNYNDKWRNMLKGKFKQLLGNYEDTEDQLSAKEIERVDMGSYERLRIEIDTVSPSLKMPIYVLIPKVKEKSKLPAVLAIHGHGYGSREVVGLNPDDSIMEDEGYHKSFAIELVKKGVVVFAPELVGFGDRKLIEDQEGGCPGDNSCYMIASQLLLVGKTLAGLRIQECRRVIDYAMTLDIVDTDKIGIMGISGGGLVTAFTAALDDRLKATVISGYTNTFKGSIMDRRHCLDNYIPGILEYAEMPKLIGLIAPRALFIEAGDQDHLFPLKEVKKALKTLEDIYKEYRAEDKLDHHIFSGGHEISGAKSYDWLINKLEKE